MRSVNINSFQPIQEYSEAGELGVYVGGGLRPGWRIATAAPQKALDAWEAQLCKGLRCPTPSALKAGH